MKGTSGSGFSWGKVVVFFALAAAVVFGVVLAYLAWTNDSFPSQQRPFASYANVSSAVFNGTEYAFTVRWASGSYFPMFAQLTSPVSDVANSPVCSLNVSKASSGQVFFMPFGISSPSTSLSDLDLRIAVGSAVNGTSFTIDYHVNQVIASPGDILPANQSCTEPSSPM